MVPEACPPRWVAGRRFTQIVLVSDKDFCMRLKIVAEYNMGKLKMVGATGFEPAAPCDPLQRVGATTPYLELDWETSH